MMLSWISEMFISSDDSIFSWVSSDDSDEDYYFEVSSVFCVLAQSIRLKISES